MKNLLIFLFGAAVGSVGTLFYLRKDIKNQLQTIENNAKNGENSGADGNKNGGSESDIPFEMREESISTAVKEGTRINYNKIIEENGYRGKSPVPITNGSDISGMDETDGGFFEIDMDEFMHDQTYAKERVVYYRGDRIMSSEAGTIFTNPAALVGSTWECCVGNYAEHTAFIRNSKLGTDYEIYVEDGLYTDEFGDENNFRED